jgi:hypothetical protein
MLAESGFSMRRGTGYKSLRSLKYQSKMEFKPIHL